MRFYGKYLNDKIASLTGIPFQTLSSPQEVPGGPSFNTGTVYSNNLENVTIPNAFEGGKTTQTNSLSNGQWSRYKSVGAELFLALPHGFTLTNSLRYLDANLSTDGVYDLQAPLPGNLLAGSFLANASLKPLLTALGVNGYQFTYADGAKEAVADITKLNGNGLVNIAGWFPDQKPAKNFINTLKLIKVVGAHALTFGAYASLYNVKEKLNYNLIVQEVANQPRLLNLALTRNGAPVIQATTNGFLYYGYNASPFYYNNEQDTRILSAYLADEWKVTDKLRFDLGLRVETNNPQGRGEKAATINNPDAKLFNLNGGLDGNFLTFADNSFLAGNGQYRTWDYTFTNLNVSVGANYKLNGRAAVYARYSNSGTTPGPDSYFFGSYDANDQLLTAPKSQRITQSEIGQKLAFDKFSLFLTEFYSQNNNIPFTIQTAGPNNTFILTQRIGRVSTASRPKPPTRS